MSFASLPLGDIAEINPSHKKPIDPETEVSFLGMADVSELGTTAPGVTRRYGEVRTGYTPFCTGDILVAKITPCFQNGKIAQARLEHEIGAGSTEFHVIRPKQDADARYLLRFLRQHWIRVEGELRMTGSGGQRRVPESYLRRLMVPLPPLAEQKRIAAFFDQVDALRIKRHEAIDLLDDLAQSIFLDTFGDLPKSARLADFAQVQGGLQLSSARTSKPQEVPYLRVANVYRGYLKLDVIKTLQASPQEIERTRLAAGDLLVVEGHGNPSEVGRVALWDGSIDVCTHQNHLIRIRVDRQYLVPEYVEMYLNSAVGRRHLLRSANTTSGLNTISTGAVKESPIAVPDLGRQHAFLSRLNRLQEVKQCHLTHLATLDELFTSLQHRAFSGALWDHEATGGAA
ncbi:putative restriction modification system DNA specificity domain [Actinacidiphila reveromycinica]|uniref:Putative restriction modification system DNA specificity domain n=1 Tax=Actinacidiphila reveromycinica TaxID=659352 RepID=A0A7U3UTJ8_9ACTN|nr:restriction endonuclease subunit S [Streptomyces sp. SN-593]BBA98406.1 putative restriction modification system DNA specificity domain [Streptomyces sp. SN-593]